MSLLVQLVTAMVLSVSDAQQLCKHLVMSEELCLSLNFFCVLTVYTELFSVNLSQFKCRPKTRPY